MNRKFILFTALTILASVFSIQAQDIHSRASIDVSGKAEKLVDPDEIILSIVQNTSPFNKKKYFHRLL